MSWKYLVAYCCGEEVPASFEAKVVLKDGARECGAVCVCHDCGRKHLVGIGGSSYANAKQGPPKQRKAVASRSR